MKSLLRLLSDKNKSNIFSVCIYKKLLFCAHTSVTLGAYVDAIFEAHKVRLRTLRHSNI